jgi:UDP-N-acetylglucosamine:LPS N-acetylglucosamine transferase
MSEMKTQQQTGPAENVPATGESGSRPRRKVLAIASRGGHWIQLLRLRPALNEVDVLFVTTDPAYKSMVDGARFRVVCEATRHQKFRMLWLLGQIFWILLAERPHAIITTGAAPGYFAIRLGKLLGAKTLWVDSIANAEEMSLSGRLASKHADCTLTQWPELASPGVAEYRGAVI